MQPNPPELDPDNWMDKHQLAKLLKVSVRDLRERLMKQPDFPKPFWITAQRIWWFKPEVAEWIRSRQM